MFKKITIALATLLLALIGLAVAMNRLAPLTTAHWLRDLSRSAAGLAPQVVSVQGQPYPYLRGGSGEPLVLVHGFTSNKDTFDAMARYLTPRFQIYAPDLPGYGDASRDPHADYSFEAQVDNLRAFILALGLTRVHLGGSSMGGGVVASYAAKYPQEVASVWLIDAAASHEASASALMARYRATGEFPLLVQTQEQHRAKLAMLFGQPKFIPYSVEYALGEAAIKDYALHRQILKVLSQSAPLETRYRDVPTPAFIVTGDLDRIIPPASVHTLAKVFPNSQLKVMPGLGHIPMVENPRQTAADYLVFRSQLKPAQ